MESLGISRFKNESSIESKHEHSGSCLKKENDEQAPVTNMISVIKSEKQDEVNNLGSTSIQSVNCFVKQDIKKECEDYITVCDDKDILPWQALEDNYMKKPKNEPVSFKDLESGLCAQSKTSSSLSEDNFKNMINICSDSGLHMANKQIEDFSLKEEIDVKFHEITDEEENSHQPSDKEAVILYTYCSSHLDQAQNQKLHHEKDEHSEQDKKYKSGNNQRKSHSDTGVNGVHNKIKCSVYSKIFSCESCSKVFHQKSSLYRHMRVHTGDIPYSCNICSNTFSESGSLTKHMRVHTGDRLYSCSICSKTFRSSRHLTKHMRVHTKDKPYSCNICSKSFRNKSSLITHMRVHTGERPYSCNICSKTFVQLGHLGEHMRAHSGDRSYSCNICSKTFSQKISLIRHQRVLHKGDKPYSCYICSKTFSRKDNLIIHMRVHTGDKPYSCNICSKTFGQSSSLAGHMIVHSDDRPYSCNICRKTFRASRSLVGHLRVHT